jgi:hypothetical protein
VRRLPLLRLPDAAGLAGHPGQEFIPRHSRSPASAVTADIHRTSRPYAGAAGRPAESHQLCDCPLTLAVPRLEPIPIPKHTPKERPSGNGASACSAGSKALSNGPARRFNPSEGATKCRRNRVVPAARDRPATTSLSPIPLTQEKRTAARLPGTRRPGIRVRVIPGGHCSARASSAGAPPRAGQVFADLYDFGTTVMKFTVAEVADRVTAPTLVTTYQDDSLVIPPSGRGTGVYKLLRGGKRFYQFTEAEGAQGHCAPMAPQTGNQVVYHWLDGIW